MTLNLNCMLCPHTYSKLQTVFTSGKTQEYVKQNNEDRSATLRSRPLWSREDENPRTDEFIRLAASGDFG